MYYEKVGDERKKVTLVEFTNSCAKLHFHKSLELVYAISGAFTVKVGDNTAIMEEGEIMFVLSYFAHSIQAMGETKSYTLLIPDNYVKNIFVKQDFPYFLLQDKKANVEILEVIKKIGIEKDGEELILQGLIFQLLGLIKRSYASVRQTMDCNDFSIKTMQYIQENFTGEITLDSISNYLGYSKYYFSHKFNEIFGCNLKTYINQIRLDNIMEMNEELSMTDKILSSGFNNLSTFYKIKRKGEFEKNKKK